MGGAGNEVIGVREVGVSVEPVQFGWTKEQRAMGYVVVRMMI